MFGIYRAGSSWFYELPTEGAGYTEIKCSDLGISTAPENSILVHLKHWQAVSRLFLWNTSSWNCVLLFDTQSFMCFIQQTARRVSTTSVSRVPESRNLKCRHRLMRSELQQTACVQNFGVEWRETAELAFCLQPVKFSFHKHASHFIIN